jgi:hypothetical protein
VHPPQCQPGRRPLDDRVTALVTTPFAEVIGDLNVKRPERHDSYVDARITWQDGDADVLTGPIDLFDRDSAQVINDYDIDLSLRFRMRDAMATGQGYEATTGRTRTARYRMSPPSS